MKKPASAGFFMSALKAMHQSFCLAKADWVIALKVPRVVINSGSNIPSISVP